VAKVFGPFRLDTLNQCLWRGDVRSPLTPKAFDVLRYLVDHNDRLITQDELLEALWPDTYVNPEGIRKYILEIRKVLGDRPDSPEFIETLPKRGYQFVAPVTESRKAGTGPAHVARNMVGRDRALTRMKDSFERASRGHRQVLFITGEAGIGKTTLLDAFRQLVADRGDPRIARGQCIERFGGIEPYYPLLEALGSQLQSGDDTFLVETLAKHAPAWWVQFPALMKAEDRARLQREISGSTRERMVRELCEALDVLALETPFVLILEDLHWVDASTLDVISALARRREAAKLLVLATYRPVEVLLTQSPLKALKEDLLIRKLCQEIALECLEAGDVGEYLSGMFDAASVPDEFSSLIHRNSGGNPLFMDAILQDMASKGRIASDGGRLVMATTTYEVEPEIPESLQRLLELQVEQLSVEQRGVLQAGSVAGERFSAWAVAAMLESPPALVEDGCDQLAWRQQFIRSLGVHEAQTGARSAHYEFRHALYRQALYRSLSAMQRCRLHLRMAEQLQAVCGGGKPDLASEVALHFEAGRDYERAARYLIEAAENAARRFSYRDSLEVLRQALDMITALPAGARTELEIKLLRQKGDAHYALGEMRASAASFKAAVELAAKADLSESRVSSLMDLAAPLWHLDPEQGEMVCQTALEISTTIADPLLAARTRLTSASLRLIYDKWRPEEAEVCAQARQAIRAIAGPAIAPDVFHVYVQAIQGNYEEALSEADIVMATTCNPTDHMQAAGARDLINLYSGRPGQVLQRLTRAVELAEANGVDPWMYLCGVAWVRMVCYDFAGACRVGTAFVRNETEGHDAFTRAVSRISAGYAHLDQRQYDAALQCFADVRDSRITRRFFLHWYWRMQAELGTTEALLHAGDLPGARRQAASFLESALSAPDPNTRVLAWEIGSRIAQTENDWNGAGVFIENALAILEEFDVPLVAWKAHRTAWKLRMQEGRRTQADAHRARARDLIYGMADSFEPAEPLRQSLLSAPEVVDLLYERASA